MKHRLRPPGEVLCIGASGYASGWSETLKKTTKSLRIRNLRCACKVCYSPLRWVTKVNHFIIVFAASSKRSRSVSTLTTSTGSEGLKRGWWPYVNTPGAFRRKNSPTAGRLSRAITIKRVLYKQQTIKPTFAWWILAACRRNVAVTTTTPFVQTDM